MSGGGRGKSAAQQVFVPSRLPTILPDDTLLGWAPSHPPRERRRRRRRRRIQKMVGKEEEVNDVGLRKGVG